VLMGLRFRDLCKPVAQCWLGLLDRRECGTASRWRFRNGDALLDRFDRAWRGALRSKSKISCEYTTHEITLFLPLSNDAPECCCMWYQNGAG
jgi:hypothetical protein